MIPPASGRPPAAEALQSSLLAWTSRAVQAFTTRSRTRGAVGAIQLELGGSAAIQGSTFSIHSALKLAARRLNRNHPLCDLPSAVIRRICSYLDPLDIVLLSHVSHDVRAALLAVSEIWSKLPMRTINETLDLRLRDIPLGIMDIFAQRSVPDPLDASFIFSDVVLSERTFGLSEKASLVSRHIHRMGKLRLICMANPLEPPGRAMWSSLVQNTLCGPAPQLATLHISYFGALEGDPPGLVPIELSGLFSGEAPSLRTLRLAAVRLFPTLHDSIFQNLAVFVYDLWSSTSLDDLRILARMPRLQIFQWGGVADFSRGSDPATILLPGSLHTLYFSFENEPDFGDLQGIVTVDRLQELWITTAGLDTASGVARLCSECFVQGISVSYGDMGPVALMQVDGIHPGGTAKVFVNIRRLNPPLTSLLSPFPSITWLTIHEHFWDNDLTGPPPALLAVTVLSVCMASGESSAHGPDRLVFAPASAGLFAADHTCRWSLPALREVRLTAPPVSTGTEHATGGKPLSISLREVARWIREEIEIEPRGRLLDNVVLSGMRIVDPDFCAAWDAMMTRSRALQLVETPDTLYHTSAAGMDFTARSASFTGGNEFF